MPPNFLLDILSLKNTWLISNAQRQVQVGPFQCIFLSQQATEPLFQNFSPAVGTPGRIGKLLCESGKHSQTRQFSTFADQFTDALSVSALTHIIFDATYRDVKKRSLFDITETRDEVFRLVLGADSVRKAIKQGKVQLVFF